MKRTIKAQVKIDKEVFFSLAKTSKEIFDLHVDWAFENKTYSKSKAHKALYEQVRKKYPHFPSALVQTTRDVALESVKATKFKTRPEKREHSSVRYDVRTMTLRGRQLTFSCIGKRQKHILNVPKYFRDVFYDWKFKGGTLCYRKKKFWVNLVFEADDPKEYKSDETLGIDKGLYNIATLSNGQVINAKEVRKQQRKHLYNRRKLQAKGTPSAKRLLKKTSGKEKRFSQDFNHRLSKQIVQLPYRTFVVEDLTGITNKRKGKQLNKWMHSWSFLQLDYFLDYKAKKLGKRLVKVSPYNTSKMCSSCGVVNGDNRNKSKYVCGSCGLMLHADVNAALNIKQKHLLSTKRSERQAAKVNQPYVETHDESSTSR